MTLIAAIQYRGFERDRMGVRFRCFDNRFRGEYQRNSGPTAFNGGYLKVARYSI